MPFRPARQRSLAPWRCRSGGVRDGQEVLGFNARQSLPSASTLKLITTATALSVLGPAYTYTTTLDYDGTIKDSVLTGNLYIRGTGDPSLGSWRFTGYPDVPALLKSWSATVRVAGIRRIQGTVVGRRKPCTTTSPRLIRGPTATWAITTGPA